MKKIHNEEKEKAKNDAIKNIHERAALHAGSSDSHIIDKKDMFDAVYAEPVLRRYTLYGEYSVLHNYRWDHKDQFRFQYTDHIGTDGVTWRRYMWDSDANDWSSEYKEPPYSWSDPWNPLVSVLGAALSGGSRHDSGFSDSLAGDGSEKFREFTGLIRMMDGYINFHNYKLNSADGSTTKSDRQFGVGYTDPAARLGDPGFSEAAGNITYSGVDNQFPESGYKASLQSIMMVNSLHVKNNSAIDAWGVGDKLYDVGVIAEVAPVHLGDVFQWPEDNIIHFSDDGEVLDSNTKSISKPDSDRNTFKADFEIPAGEISHPEDVLLVRMSDLELSRIEPVRIHMNKSTNSYKLVLYLIPENHELTKSLVHGGCYVGWEYDEKIDSYVKRNYSTSWEDAQVKYYYYSQF